MKQNKNINTLLLDCFSAEKVSWSCLKHGLIKQLPEVSMLWDEVEASNASQKFVKMVLLVTIALYVPSETALSTLHGPTAQHSHVPMCLPSLAMLLLWSSILDIRIKWLFFMSREHYSFFFICIFFVMLMISFFFSLALVVSALNKAWCVNCFACSTCNTKLTLK